MNLGMIYCAMPINKSIPRLSGRRGDPGPSGLTGPPGGSQPVGFLVVRHSQGQNIPTCPDGARKLWEGYSLLHLEGNDRATNQDLGK